MPSQRFACPCCKKNLFDPRLERLVEEIEKAVDWKIPINSGYRCEKHNRAIGGSVSSSHLKGLAVDLGVNWSRIRFFVLKKAIELGISRIGVARNFIHIDIDDEKDPDVVWTY